MGLISTATLWLAAPVDGAPAAPGGAQAPVNSLWSNGLWIFAVCAAFGMLFALGSVIFNHTQGRSNDWAWLGKIVAACVGVGMIAGFVGGLTGT